jgi:hypothetical protein
MADASELIMKRNNLTNQDVDWLVPHQANKRIIDATASRMNLEESKVLMNIESMEILPLQHYLVLYDFEHLFKKGDTIILAAFGGGFTWGSVYLKWRTTKNNCKLKQINMDLKEIQNLIKFVANSGVAEVKLEMDDIKITIRTTIEGTATETTCATNAHNQQAMPVQNAAPVAAVVDTLL